MSYFNKKKQTSSIINFFPAVVVGAFLAIGIGGVFYTMVLMVTVNHVIEEQGRDKGSRKQKSISSAESRNSINFYIPFLSCDKKKPYKLAAMMYASQKELAAEEKKILTEENGRLQKELKTSKQEILKLQEVLSLVHSEAELEQFSKHKKEKEIYSLKKKFSFIKQRFQNVNSQLKKKEQLLAKKMGEPSLDVIINTALAKKATPAREVSAKLFSKLRDVFYLIRGVAINDDRLILESKNIFVKDTSRLAPQGKKYLSLYVRALKETMESFPKSYPWILRISSYTDARPFKSKDYSSNLHLSASRAAVVMDFLCSQGMQGENMSAGGYGSYHQINKDSSMEAHRQNNRLELKVDQK